MSPLIQIIHGEFWERGIPECTKRETTILESPGKISSIIGMRRSGKTYLMFDRIRDLIKNNIKPEQILYLNLEDDRLEIKNSKELGSLIDSFFELFPDNFKRPVFLFLDEIQEISSWEKVARRFLDSKNVSIWITGSSATLLSKELATGLRGRAIITETYPFSFKEWLTHTKENVLLKKIRGPAFYATVKKLLRKYLLCGGFPEVSLVEEFKRVRILQDYKELVIMKDIVERHRIHNLGVMNALISTIISSASCSISINKIFNDFKSRGLTLGKDTLYEYMKFLEDAYFSFSVRIHTDSNRKREVNPFKSYLIDPGMITACKQTSSEDIGRLFENLIFLDLKRSGYNLSYNLSEEGHEVDFVALNSISKKVILIQACWDSSNVMTFNREQRALDEAKKKFKCKALLVTPDSYLDFIELL